MTTSTKRSGALNLRNLSVFALSAILISLSVCALGKDWPIHVIVPNGDAGPINFRVTRADLTHRYGAANVVDEEVGLGEGDTDTATVLFPKDRERRIEILWQDRQKEAYPSSVTISGQASRWHAVHGISLGMLYSELARVNGKPSPISWGIRAT